MSTLNFIFPILFLMVSTISFADSVEFQCPHWSKLVKKDNQWSAEIPATHTQDGYPISAITLVGNLKDQVGNTNNIKFRIRSGIAVYTNDKSELIIECDYNTQEEGNYGYGRGIDIYLTGKVKEVDLLSKYKCDLVGFSEDKTIVCSNK